MPLSLLQRRINFWLLVILALNAVFWAGGKYVYARWAGVPPPPSVQTARMGTLGDTELAYRSGAMTLQHLGDSGGRTTPLREYDYDMLGKWLWLLHRFNPASDHLPYVAGFYFGAVRGAPEKTAVIVDYLYHVGQNPVGEKWRWLSEAAFLARYRMDDLDRSLEIAYTLARMKPLEGALPSWARELPALILEAKGENAAAQKIITSLLLSDRDLPQQELNFMIYYLTDQLGMSWPEMKGILAKRKKLFPDGE